MGRADAAENRSSGMGFSDVVKLVSLLLVSGVLALNLTVVRPIKQRLEGLQQEMGEVRDRMDLLATERDQVRNANDLLSLLHAQRAHVEESYAAIKTIRQFRTDVEAEAAKATAAMPSVERLVELEKLLVQQHQYAEPASRVLEETAAMQHLLAKQEGDVEEAGRVLQRMVDIQRNLVVEADDAERAQIGLERLSDLKRRILSQTRGAEQARKGLDVLGGLLAYIIQETDDIGPAQSAVEALLAIKDRLVIRGSGIQAARGHVDQLLDLRDRLALMPSRSETADQHLNRLLEMQSRLVSIENAFPPTSRGGESWRSIRESLANTLESLGVPPERLLQLAAVQFPLLRAAWSFQLAIRPTGERPGSGVAREGRNTTDRTSQRKEVFGPRHFLTHEWDDLNGIDLNGQPSWRIWPANN